jgi:TonB-linked SusC/RagA family outer membrane protein
MRKSLWYLLFFVFAPFIVLNAQNITVRTITGTLTNKVKGETLVGVSIFVPGTTNGVTTGPDGRYSINIRAKDTVLQFSYVGFLTQVVQIQNQTQINVILEEDVQAIETVVVVGYGTQKKSDLTGAISTVDMHSMEKRSVSTIDQALQGQVAGVDVTSNSGTPGGGVMVRIRGIGTLNDSDPLFVIDGMMVSDINFLNPNDVENITVLKDASSTAIYGSRGSNGVVIITTKKGHKGGQVNFSSYYGVQNLWRSNNVLDAPTWGYLKNEAMVAAGNLPAISDPSKLQTTDYLKAISNKNAPISNMDLSFSGGGDKGDYFFSVNKFNQQGIINKTGFDRTSLRANSSYNVESWLKIGENITLAQEKSQTGVEGDEWTSMIVTSITRDPATPVRNTDGTFRRGIYNDIWNPVAVIQYANNQDVIYRSLGNIFADISLMKGLVFRTNYSLEYSSGETDAYVPVYYVFSVQQNTVSKLSKTNSSRLTGQWSNTLNYEKSFGKHTISALIGAETYSFDYKWNGLSVNNVPNDNPDIRYIDNAIGKNQASVFGNISQVRQLSGLTRLNYDYMEKYLFTANFRADASSKFTNKNRWGYFPSFSLGWKITEEPFLKSNKIISTLKLRGGWGQIGNQGSVAPYQYVTSAQSGANYVWGGVLAPGFSFPGAGNDEIKWETSTTENIGLDFGLFDGRLSGSIDYFIKNTSGMLLQVPVPGQTGIQNAPTQNAGAMQNSGIELSAIYKNSSHGLSYSIGVNFSKINNKVVDLGPDNAFIDGAFFFNSYYVTRTIVGQSIAQFYGYKTDGLFQNQSEINAQTAQKNVAPGDVRYVDANKDGILDYYFLGSPLPKFTYSLNGNVSYKGFDLSCSLQGVYGNKIFNGPSIYSRSSTATWNLSRDMINRWTGEGTQTDARYPRLNAADVNNTMMSDRLIEDGSYLRIKTLQLGYNLGESLTRALKLENLRVFVNAQNLFTFTKYTGLDPEIGMRNALDMGVDRGSYPQARVYSVGLNVTF